MTAPVRLEAQDPFDAALRQRRPPADAFDAALASRGPGLGSLQAEYKSGRLAGRMQRENANDLEARESDPSYAAEFGRHLFNTAQGIPGVEAVEAAAGAAGSHATSHPMSYTQALATLRGETEKIDPMLRVGEQLAGSYPAFAATAALKLPGGPLVNKLIGGPVKGAALGAAHGLAEADPDADRVGDAELQGLIGGGIGAAFEVPSLGVGLAKAVGPKLGKVAGLVSALRGKGAASTAKTARTMAALDKMRPVGPLSSTADAKLSQLLNVLRGQAPAGEEAGNVVGDAELGMQEARAAARPHESDDLEDLLRRSLKDRGVTPSVSVAPEPAVKPAGPARSLRDMAKLRDANGRIRSNLSQVPDDVLGQEWERLAQMNADEEGIAGSVEDSGYRADYHELPRTEKFGLKGQEDLPDADGMVDPERLAADNKTMQQYRKGALVRSAREKLMNRLQEELASRSTTEDFPFGANAQQDILSKAAKPRGAP